jgi:peptidoglycan L-alanyl-D-glutamate endopeptidase CwlK
MGGKVTNARGGQSYHNFGIAADFALDKDAARDGLQPDWSFESYRVLAEEAKAIGLEPGFYWKSFPDAPHCQLPLSRVGLKLQDLSALYSKGGMPLVWAALDKYNW